MRSKVKGLGDANSPLHKKNYSTEYEEELSPIQLNDSNKNQLVLVQSSKTVAPVQGPPPVKVSIPTQLKVNYSGPVSLVPLQVEKGLTHYKGFPLPVSLGMI